MLNNSRPAGYHLLLVKATPPTSRGYRQNSPVDGKQITRIVRIADLKFHPAIRTNPLDAHMAGKPVLRIRPHE